MSQLDKEDAAGILAKLETMHGEILSLVQALEDLAREPEARMAAVASVRLKLTQASRRRSDYLENVVYPLLLSQGEPGNAARVMELREAGIRGRMASTTHIAKWTPVQIADNWPAYVEASAIVRMSMRDRIAREKAVIYPALKRM